MGIPGTEVQSEKIRIDLGTLMARSEDLEQTNRVMSDEIATLRKRNDELEKESAQFEIFRPILQNPPTRLEVCIRDKRVAMELYARVKTVYKGRKSGDDESDDPAQRRLFRVNLDTIALACLKTGLASWDRTFARHLSPVAGTR